MKSITPVLPDLEQLKNWGAYNEEGHEALVSVLSKYKRVLVLGTKNAGKCTVQHAVVNLLHRTHQDPLVIPSIEGVNLKTMRANKKLQELRQLCKKQKSVVAAIQHTNKDSVETLLKGFEGMFDCILDFRNLEGQRVMHTLYAGKSLRPLYLHKKSV